MFDKLVSFLVGAKTTNYSLINLITKHYVYNITDKVDKHLVPIVINITFSIDKQNIRIYV